MSAGQTLDGRVLCKHDENMMVEYKGFTNSTAIFLKAYIKNRKPQYITY